jgi:hypothetical protein
MARTRARVLLLCFAVIAVVGLASRTAAAKEPEKVHVGIYVNQVHELNLKESFFVVDFYLWFRWTNDELKAPYETFSLVDGRIESKTEIVKRKLADAQNYAYLRIVAKFTKFWDVRDFPFDHHLVAITVEEEESETSALTYVADEENSRASPRITMPGWIVARSDAKASAGTYQSNFGDTTLATGRQTSYPRMTMSLALERPGSTYFFKMFSALWIAAAIAFLAFFIKPTNVDPRFGLGVGAIFAAIASEYVVTSSLPDVNVVTLADKLHIVAFTFIFVVLAQSTVSLWLFEKGREAESKRLDRLFAFALPALYVLANVAFARPS